MTSLKTLEIKNNFSERECTNLYWKNSPSVQHLLEVISSILAEEYIMIAKKNPGMLIQHEDPK